MKDKIHEYLKIRKNLEKEFRKYVKDVSIPLEIRWKLFIESEMGDEYEGEFPGVDWNNHTFYDDFYMDRFAVGNVEDILKTALKNKIFEENGEIIFKEFCLNEFCNRIENDW